MYIYIYIVRKVLTHWVASYYSSLHPTLLHGRTFSSTAGDKWRITFAQQLTVLGVKLVSRLTFRDKRQNRSENCTIKAFADFVKKYWITHLVILTIMRAATCICLHTLVSTEYISRVTHTPFRTGSSALAGWRRVTGRLARRHAGVVVAVGWAFKS